jgi:CheY-like chemotaxis protein
VNTQCDAGVRSLFPDNGWHVHANRLSLEPAPIRILVVNDDLRSAGTLRHTLAELGYSETMIAYSGKRALATVAGYSPSVAIVDLEIADMTGYRLAEMLKGHALRKVRDLPLIAVAEQGGSAIDELARAAGFIGVLTKPVRPWQLRRLLLRDPRQ